MSAVCKWVQCANLCSVQMSAVLNASVFVQCLCCIVHKMYIWYNILWIELATCTSCTIDDYRCTIPYKYNNISCSWNVNMQSERIHKYKHLKPVSIWTRYGWNMHTEIVISDYPYALLPNMPGNRKSKWTEFLHIVIVRSKFYVYLDSIRIESTNS